MTDMMLLESFNTSAVVSRTLLADGHDTGCLWIMMSNGTFRTARPAHQDLETSEIVSVVLQEWSRTLTMPWAPAERCSRRCVIPMRTWMTGTEC